LDGLVDLLLHWNGGCERITKEDSQRLMRLAASELGWRSRDTVVDAGHVWQLASALSPALPHVQGDTIADLFGLVREVVVRVMSVEETEVRWDSLWEDLFKQSNSYWEDLDFDLLEHLEEAICAGRPLDHGLPLDTIGETVRAIWKARGGHGHWERAPYESHRRPCAGVLRDFARLPQIVKLVAQARERGTLEGRLTPATLLTTFLRDADQSTVLGAIEQRFGVRIGRRSMRFDMLACLLSGLLVSPLNGCVAGAVFYQLHVTGSVAIAIMCAWLACGVVGAVALYRLSRPRLPNTARTVGDLVRAIVRAREKRPRPRMRPIHTQIAPAEYSTTRPSFMAYTVKDDATG